MGEAEGLAFAKNNSALNNPAMDGGQIINLRKNKVFLTNYKNTRMYFCSGDPELNSG